MENPYYDIISLVRSQSGGPGGDVFSAEAALDEEEKLCILIGGEPVEESFWLPAEMELTEEDDGCALLCRQFDGGILVLAKIKPF